tara:strand:+ start:9950 stop:10180 length:231 start_codon:yes stop_codon:yes gene_type:complete
MENFIKIGAEKIAESVIVENIVSYSKEFAQFCENNPFFIPYLLTFVLLCIFTSKYFKFKYKAYNEELKNNKLELEN